MNISQVVFLLLLLLLLLANTSVCRSWVWKLWMNQAAAAANLVHSSLNQLAQYWCEMLARKTNRSGANPFSSSELQLKVDCIKQLGKGESAVGWCKPQRAGIKFSVNANNPSRNNPTTMTMTMKMPRAKLNFPSLSRSLSLSASVCFLYSCHSLPLSLYHSLPLALFLSLYLCWCICICISLSALHFACGVKCHWTLAVESPVNSL